MVRKINQPIKKRASAEAILQNIGRVHFNYQRVFPYTIRYPFYVSREVYYDWVNKSSDYERFNSNRSCRGLCSFKSKPHRIVDEIHSAMTKDEFTGSRHRLFRVKATIYVMERSLADWEKLGYGHGAAGVGDCELKMRWRWCSGFQQAHVETLPLTEEERRRLAERDGLERLEYVVLPEPFIQDNMTQWGFTIDVRDGVALPESFIHNDVIVIDD